MKTIPRLNKDKLPNTFREELRQKRLAKRRLKKEKHNA